MCEATRGAAMSLVKITLTTKRETTLLGSEVVKFMSQPQIAAIGQDLQYFLQIICPKTGPLSHALKLPF